MTDFRQKLESWASINSYSYNLRGLEKMRDILVAELEALGAAVHVQELEDHSYINDRGLIEKRKLGKMLIFEHYLLLQ